MNKVRTKSEETSTPVESTKPSNGRFIKLMYAFGIFSKEGLVTAMPYVFFLMLLALVYIGNSYEAERVIRDIDRTEKELKALRTDYISGKSDLMYTSKQSEVARMSTPFGLVESKSAPMKIAVVKPKQEQQEYSIWERLKRIFS
jgi:hypothetical protein